MLSSMGHMRRAPQTELCHVARHVTVTRCRPKPLWLATCECKDVHVVPVPERHGFRSGPTRLHDFYWFTKVGKCIGKLVRCLYT